MIGEALRLIRVFNDIKAKDLADQLDISPNYLSEIEKGKKVPSMAVLNKYSGVFGIKTSTLLFFSEELAEKKTLGDNARNWVANKLVTFLKVIENESN